jgi:aromatic-L-amino-acid/L-tryptophan decarboxylase
VPDVPALSLNEDERQVAGRLLTAFFDDYERSIPQRPIFPAIDREALSGLLTTPFPDKGIGVEGLFRAINQKILPNTTTLSHPRFLAFVVGPGNGIAPYADAIAATLNQNCAAWPGGPAACVIEQSVVAWLAGLFGYGERAGGIVTAGGSMATLDALATMLHARRPHFRERGLQTAGPPLVVYTSAEAHWSVDKAAAILGIGLDNVRHVPVDGQYQMRFDALKAMIRSDRTAGLEPACVVATPGTINTGAIDPIAEIADVCAHEDLWLHLDAAYGGLFVLSARLHDALEACARADSITVDPHKLLFASFEAGCLLVRDRTNQTRAFAFSPSIVTFEEDPLIVNYMDYGSQLSRGFKALKIWSALQTFGVEAFKSAIDHTLDLAQYMAELIEAEPDVELMAPVPLTAVCFQIKDASEADHAAALARLNEQGAAFLNPVHLDGRHGLRACVSNFRTTRSDIDLIVARVAEAARGHQRGGRAVVGGGLWRPSTPCPGDHMALFRRYEVR